MTLNSTGLHWPEQRINLNGTSDCDYVTTATGGPRGQRRTLVVESRFSALCICSPAVQRRESYAPELFTLSFTREIIVAICRRPRTWRRRWSHVFGRRASRSGGA